LISPVSACGRCGAPNSEDAEFCQSCGALLAAYRAPSGATEVPAPDASSINDHAVQPTPYQPPIQRPRPTPVDLIVPSGNSNAAAISVDNESSPDDAIVKSVEVSGPEPSLSPTVATLSPSSTGHEAATATRAKPSPPSASTATQRQSPPLPSSSPASSDPLPILDAHRALSGRNSPKPTTASGSNRKSNAGRRNSTPHLLIFAGVSAFMLAFFIGVSAGSTMSVVLLFIGGPLGFGLIMAGVLLLIGRHPTGRP
jgi:hypothetical protein